MHPISVASVNVNSTFTD